MSITSHVDGDYAMSGGYSKTPLDYLAALRRHKGLLLVAFALVFAGSVAAAMVIPPKYRSTATILIEEPEVPPDLVQSTVTSFADQRIQLIKYRVLTTQSLTDIMNRFGLYTDDRLHTPITRILDDFRKDIGVQIINAQVLNPSSGRPTSATIAFNVWYQSKSPRTAQQVANELVTLYLSENTKERQGQAASTSKFLADESQRLENVIRDLETNLATFKQKNADRLPQQLAMNQDLSTRALHDLSDVDARMSELRERRGYLEQQIATVPPILTGTAAMQAADPTLARLAQLKSDASRLRVTKGPRHPDVLRMEDEIAGIEATLAPTPVVNDPALAAAVATAPQGMPNPLYVSLRSQINDAQAQLTGLTAQRATLVANRDAYQSRLTAAPEVEREYLALVRNYENAQRTYNETKDKQVAAELAQALEMESKSERFSLIEPPQLPSEALFPNKPLIVLGGLLGAIGAAVMLVFLVDMLDSRIHAPRQLAYITGEMPLVVIPYIHTPVERRRRMGMRLLYGASAVAVVVVGMAVVNDHVMPLDVLWLKALGTGRDVLGALRS